mmetsp:Transcript_47317/g.133461  ORF Transcript_47317/g.133461 Transcript_47317/m.133461 type:complete len:405 (+) Transcript_47317:90-1304(+)
MAAEREMLPSPLLGVDRCTVRCWEYGTVMLGPEEQAGGSVPSGDISVVLAWFGDPEDASQRCDVTRQMQELLESSGAPPGCAAEVPATTRLWGDPARFRMKQLEVTFDHTWLSADERGALGALQRRVSEKAQKAPELEDLLCRLSDALMGALCRSVTVSEAMPSAPLGRTSPRWRQLGFQSSDPRTDLRTGKLALEALVYLAERYPLAAGQMVREAQSDGIDYPFAVASINVTQLLARYLGLAGDITSTARSGGHVAPRRVVQRFARLLLNTEATGVDTFGELHAAVMARLHAAWRARKVDDPELTIMDFPPALDETLAAVHAFCLSAALESAGEFRILSGGGEDEHAVSTDVGEPASYGILHASVRRSVKSVAETAGILGTYIQGVFGEHWDARPSAEREAPG